MDITLINIGKIVKLASGVSIKKSQMFSFLYFYNANLWAGAIDLTEVK